MNGAYKQEQELNQIKMENTEEKLNSLGSVVIVGKGMVKQIRFDMENLEANHTKSMEAVKDPRIKSLHTIIYNKHINNFEELAKEIEKATADYQEELENEIEKSKTQKTDNSQA